jgi:hypothetical protein
MPDTLYTTVFTASYSVVVVALAVLAEAASPWHVGAEAADAAAPFEQQPGAPALAADA